VFYAGDIDAFLTPLSTRLQPLTLHSYDGDYTTKMAASPFGYDVNEFADVSISQGFLRNIIGRFLSHRMCVKRLCFAYKAVCWSILWDRVGINTEMLLTVTLEFEIEVCIF